MVVSSTLLTAQRVAENLRRLMVRLGLTLEEVVQRTGLDERTIKAILAGGQKPHAKTLYRLANGLEVNSDELFQEPSQIAYRLFDQKTNPLVDQVIAEHPAWFTGWAQADYDALYSNFGTGGGLTADGVERLVQKMNRQREIHRKVALLLESNQADVLSSLVDVLYQKILVNHENFFGQ